MKRSRVTIVASRPYGTLTIGIAGGVGALGQALLEGSPLIGHPNAADGVRAEARMDPGLRRDDVLGRGLEHSNRVSSMLARPSDATARPNWST